MLKKISWENWTPREFTICRLNCVDWFIHLAWKFPMWVPDCRHNPLKERQDSITKTWCHKEAAKVAQGLEVTEMRTKIMEAGTQARGK
jgi:hypothetical protein